jgi:hypothetical protein
VSDKLWHALNESECEQSKTGNGDDSEEAPSRTAAKTQAKIRQISADALDALQTFRGECCFSGRPGDGHKLASLNN